MDKADIKTCRTLADTSWRKPHPLLPQPGDSRGQVIDPQTNVVDVNVGRLRRKLEEGFDGPVLETVWGTGYRLIAAGGARRG